MLDYYQTAKERERKRRRMKRVAIVAAIFFVLIISGGIFLLRSNALQMKGIAVIVQDDSLVDSVKQIFFNQISSQSFLSRLLLNRNSIVLAEMNKGAVAREIQSQMPLLKNVSINVDLFSRTVLITASLRERYGLWCQENIGIASGSGQEASSSDGLVNTAGCFWFDRDGVVFSEGPSAEGQLIRKIIDTDPASVPLGMGNSVLKASQMKVLLAIFDFMNSIDLPQTILFLNNEALEEVATDNTQTPVFYFSLRNDPAYALKAIEGMGSKISKLQYIDLRVANRIYYK